MKLNVKLSVFTLVIIILVIVMLSYSLFVYEKRNRIEDIKTQQKAIFSNFSNLTKEALVLHDEILLLNIMQAFKNTYWGIKYINFVSSKGRVLYTDKSASARAIDKQYADRKIVEEYRSGFIKEFLEMSTPVYIQGERLGVAQIGFSKTDYNKFISKTISKARNKIFLIALIALIFGLVCALVLSRTIAGPIKKLADGANAIGEGDFSTRIDIKSKDELGMLADEFNLMAEKFAELDKAKDEFVNAVSHELRTPLAAIEGYIDFLMEAGTDLPQEKIEKALRIMKSSSQRLSQFINDILDIAKVKSSRMVFDLQRHDLRSIVGKVLGLLNSVAAQKQIELVAEIAPDLPYVMADDARINQVITNLVGNALKFTPENGRITVGGQVKDDRTIMVYVNDTGPGIPEQDLHRIFAQFEQSENAKNIKGPKGTGLGLAIAEGIVKSHGGKIWVESEVGKGTTFIFTLPLSMEDA